MTVCIEEDGVKNYATAYQLRVVVPAKAWKIGSRSQIEPFCNCNGGRLFIKVVVSRIDGASGKMEFFPLMTMCDGTCFCWVLLVGGGGKSVVGGSNQMRVSFPHQPRSATSPNVQHDLGHQY